MQNNHKTFVILNKKTNQVVTKFGYGISYVRSAQNAIKTYSSYNKAKSALKKQLVYCSRYGLNYPYNPFLQLRELVIAEIEIKPDKIFPIEEWAKDEKKKK